MVMKLFILISNLSNEGKYPRSWCNTPSSRLQPRRLNTFKECKPKEEGNCNPTVGDEWNEKTRFLDFNSPPLHSTNDNSRRFFKREIEGGTLCIPLPSAFSSAKHCRLPKSSGDSFSPEQP